MADICQSPLNRVIHSSVNQHAVCRRVSWVQLVGNGQVAERESVVKRLTRLSCSLAGSTFYR